MGQPGKEAEYRKAKQERRAVRMLPCLWNRNTESLSSHQFSNQSMLKQHTWSGLLKQGTTTTNRAASIQGIQSSHDRPPPPFLHHHPPRSEDAAPLWQEQGCLRHPPVSTKAQSFHSSVAASAADTLWLSANGTVLPVSQLVAMATHPTSLHPTLLPVSWQWYHTHA